MGLVDMLGAGLRSQIAQKALEEGLIPGTGEASDERPDANSVKSARERLHSAGYVVVQYPSLEAD